MRPTISVLDEEIKEKVVVEALEILEELGVFVENKEALELLQQTGIEIDLEKGKVKLPSDMVTKAIESAPSSFKLYDRNGQESAVLGGDNICFDPGSAALNVLDRKTNDIRPGVTKDFVEFTKVVDQLEYIKAQSTAIVCSDVPDVLSDRFRLFISLLFSSKPVITGTFLKESFANMKDMLVSIRGSEKELKAKPLAIFDACPSPPLKWSDLTCQSIIDAAKAGIPSEFVSMPMTGANAPITILGSIVQHAAETLAGVVITQLVSPGTPVVWGGSPAAFDMRKGTTPMGSIDTMILDLGYVEIGKYLNFPTHAYLGMSDAKILDMQSGFETGMGTLLAATKGVNMISGAGMIDFETTQSIQKVIIDNEICGMAYKFIEGIQQRDEPIAKHLLAEFDEKTTHLLAHDHTFKWFKKEHFIPSTIIDRATNEEWKNKGRQTIAQRATERIPKLLKKYPGVTLEKEIITELVKGLDYKALNLDSILGL
ncbi:MAG: trimethylamine methyltransferase family protein [Candidatus Heimdallarchaeota archaeon]